MRDGLEAVAIKNLQSLLVSRGVSAESLFSKYDIDGNGSLSPDEFSAALVSITGQSAPEAIVRAIVSALDSDGDGSLSLPEVISLIESDTDEEYSEGSGITVSDHPNPMYNGVYTPQNEINGKPSFRNSEGAVLYFYNAGSGGAPSWSLDDRDQDGSNDWYRGGWTRVPSSGGLPLGHRRWVGVGKITISSDSGPSSPGPSSPESISAQDQELSNTEINLSKASFSSSEEISFHFRVPQLPEDAWIGIIPSEIPHGNEAVNDMHDTSFVHLHGKTTGEAILPNPGPGEWTLRLHDSDNNGNEMAYVPFTVRGIEPATRPSITVVAGNTVPADGPLEISFTGVDDAAAWIGIYPEQNGHENHNGWWKYLNGEQTPPSTPISEGNITFQPSERRSESLGSYQARMFADNGYEMIAQTRFEYVEEITLDSITGQFSDILSSIDPQSSSVEAIEAARSKADAEIEGKISRLPFHLQSPARRIWDARADAYQAAIVARLPPADKVAAGVAAAGIAAAAISSATRETSTSYEGEPMPETTSKQKADVEKAKAVNVDEPASELETPRPPPEPPEVPSEPTTEAGDEDPFYEVVQSFSEARLMSDQKRLAEIHGGASYAVSLRVLSVEKTFGIGLSERYRGGSTLIAEVSPVGSPSFSCDSEIRLPLSADSSIYKEGHEEVMRVSVQGWNSIRKRIILGS
tara:strand:- start:2189 stop:4264 length:2076 start_codon:yes stop_codon:yes gene_type:complete